MIVLSAGLLHEQAVEDMVVETRKNDEPGKCGQ